LGPGYEKIFEKAGLKHTSHSCHLGGQKIAEEKMEANNGWDPVLDFCWQFDARSQHSTISSYR
jgi:hypothetical protein